MFPNTWWNFIRTKLKERQKSLSKRSYQFSGKTHFELFILCQIPGQNAFRTYFESEFLNKFNFQKIEIREI